MDYGKRGWIFALNRSSNWGDVTNFYEEMVYGGIKSEDLKSVLMSSDIWGKIFNKNFRPKEGDGIAFYHSSKALFPKGDYYNKKRRISLIGKIFDVTYDKNYLEHIAFDFKVEDARILKVCPILRDIDSEFIFQKSGVVPHKVGTFYFVDEETWPKLIKLIEDQKLKMFSIEIKKIISSSHKVKDAEASLKIANDMKLIGESKEAKNLIIKILNNDLFDNVKFFNSIFFALNEFYENNEIGEIITIVVQNTLKFKYGDSVHFSLLEEIVEKDYYNLIDIKQFEKLLIYFNNNIEYFKDNLELDAVRLLAFIDSIYIKNISPKILKWNLFQKILSVLVVCTTILLN